ncbi:MAG: hypothetical protein IKD64_02630 [Lachnospiraceae bacterium]|nr:hypothetical protein [Lachnospiraceae bacterium]
MMSGCEKNPSEDPVSGGVIDHSDPSAPKEIKSKELVSMETGFYRYETDPAEGGYRYSFSLKPIDGKLTLTEDKRYQIGCEVEEAVLDKVEEIIEQYDLVQWNGKNRYTSGLPEEYSPYYFSAEYASGERLYFYLDGDPEAEWSGALLKFFREVFAVNGHPQVLPPEESYVFTRFDFAYNEGETFYSYGNILMPGRDTDYITCLHKYVWSLDESEEEDLTIIVPDGYFAKVKELVEECNLYELTNWSIMPPTFHPGDADYYGFTLETADGRQFSRWYTGDEIPPEMNAVKEKVVAFLDPVFEEGEEYSADLE